LKGDVFTKAIKTQMFNFFIKKDTITMRVWQWAFQVEAYFETQNIVNGAS
jgi:hypothetical protein